MNKGKLSYALHGIAGSDVTSERAMRVAQIVGALLPSKARVIIGKDTRRPNYMIEAALVTGFVSVGAHVINTGPVPIAGIAHLVSSMRCSLGVMITAPDDAFGVTGIVLFDADGVMYSPEQHETIRRVSAEPFAGKLAQAEHLGNWKRLEGPYERVVEATKRSVDGLELAGNRIVVDCAHGAAYRSAPTALEELGAEVFALGVDPDGINVNEGVGLAHPHTMRAKVRDVRADFGITLDAAGYQVLLVDRSGTAINTPRVECNGLSDDGLVRALHAIKKWRT